MAGVDEAADVHRQAMSGNTGHVEIVVGEVSDVEDLGGDLDRTGKAIDKRGYQNT